jgi:DUF1009 family protein
VGEAIGLVAGGGLLPLIVARAIRRAGHRVVCVQLDGEPIALEAVCDVHAAIPPTEAARVLRTLRDHGVRRLVLVGQVRKLRALGGRPDPVAQTILQAAKNRTDGGLWRAVAGLLEASGFEILPQAHFTPDLLAPEGPLSRRIPEAHETEDLAVGLRVARAVSDLGIGQAVAVREGVVLAVEAAEGTDGMIRRLAPFGPGAVVAKAGPTDLDVRFDLPAIGPDTIRAMQDVGATALGVEAGRALLLERDTTVALADAAGIALVGL